MENDPFENDQFKGLWANIDLEVSFGPVLGDIDAKCYCLPRKDPVASLAAKLRELDGDDDWWSPHVWTSNTPSASAWKSSAVIVVDLDCLDDDGKPSKVIDRRLLDQILVGNLMLFGDFGVRLIFVLDAPIVDKDMYLAACAGVTDSTQCSLEDAKMLAKLDFDATRRNGLCVRRKEVTFAERFDAPHCDLFWTDSVWHNSLDPYSLSTFIDPQSESAAVDHGYHFDTSVGQREGFFRRSPDGIYHSTRKGIRNNGLMRSVENDQDLPAHPAFDQGRCLEPGVVPPITGPGHKPPIEPED